MSEEEIKKIRKLMEDAEWDVKAEDFWDARKKLEEAKEIAKEIRNEELIKQILELIKKTHRDLVI